MNYWFKACVMKEKLNEILLISEYTAFQKIMEVILFISKNELNSKWPVEQ